MKPRNIFTALALIAFCSLGVFAQGGAKSSGPQLIRDVDQPAKQHVYRMVHQAGIVLETVPEGKVLVIENVNVAEGGTGGIGEITLSVVNDTGSLEGVEFLPPSHIGSGVIYVAQPTKLYVPAGRKVIIGFSLTPLYFKASISGYYVDVQ